MAGCPTAWKPLKVPVGCLSALAKGEKPSNEGKEGHYPGFCGYWDQGQKNQVMDPAEGRLGVGSACYKAAPVSHTRSHTDGLQQLNGDPLLKFHYMLKKLQLHKEEYVLMQAISLFSPGDGLPLGCQLPVPLACCALPMEGPRQYPCSPLMPSQLASHSPAVFLGQWAHCQAQVFPPFSAS